MNFTTDNGTVWTNVEDTTLFVGEHAEAPGSIALADAVSSEKIIILDAEIAPLIAALQARLPKEVEHA